MATVVRVERDRSGIEIGRDANGRAVEATARWRDPDGKQQKRKFKGSKCVTEAKAHKAQMESSKRSGTYIDPNDRITVAEYARHWAAAQPHGVRTARGVNSRIRNHLEDLPLGRMRLQSVRATDVQAWATGRSKVLADSTVRNLVGMIRTIFLAALDDGRIGKVPARKVRLPEPDDKRVVPLTISQVLAIRDAFPPRQAAMVTVQAALGLRAGELLGLRVSDVDWLRRTVRIVCQLEPESKERKRTDPKTKRSVRTLPLPQVAADAMAAHLAQWPAGADGSIWTTKSGRTPRHDHLTKSFRMARERVAAADLKRKPAERVNLPENVSSHALRHHYASVLLASGASVVEVAERLGHRDAAMVLRVYGHLLPGRDDSARQAIDDAWTTGSAPEVPGVGSATS